MRATISFRGLIIPAALLAAGCDDSPMLQEPPASPDEASVSAPTRWADGYLLAGSPTTASYAPLPNLSYNRSGGRMNITKPAGTTGRYIVTFTGLSALLGSKNMVRVTEYGLDDTYCKPVNGRLVSDKLEVRCFKASTRTPANSGFTVTVSGARADRAFAYAHQPTTGKYSPASSGSSNPAGSTEVVRHGVGGYEVTFRNFRAKIPNGVGGHAQANAVGIGNAHCVVEDWGGTPGPDLPVWVQCYTPAGSPVDSKFTVLFVLPAAHMAYTYASPNYPPQAYWSWNPSGGAVTATRNGVGDYTVFWTGVDPKIVDVGTVQVTSVSDGNQQCKATSLFATGVGVHCFGPSGAPADSDYSVMLGS